MSKPLEYEDFRVLYCEDSDHVEVYRYIGGDEEVVLFDKDLNADSIVQVLQALGANVTFAELPGEQ